MKCSIKSEEIATSVASDGFSTRSLNESDAPALSALLTRQSIGYRRYFTPFAFDEATVVGVLTRAREDVFGGFYRGGELIGFFMLRGWDEGYDVPALGVLIDEKYRGYQAYKLMALTVELGKSICRQRGVRRIMYKAHTDNTPARSARRLGFTQTGVDERTGFRVFHLDLDDL